MVCTNDDIIAYEMRKYKDLYHSDIRFIHEKIGYNYRMTNMQAAI
ncbi:MAG: DegT/DnrJ/EryC1/StrS family aminotransferase [bacterium]